MFSALKRLTTRSDTNGAANTPPGLHAMSSTLQKKFSKGVQYNMKIILKGDRNSGKTCLFRRLQGLPFVEEYTPTDEIQAANIQWNYKTTDDVVKVEVWDVVDKAKKKKSLPNKLKIDNAQANKAGEEEDVQEIGLDASFLDVYKNTNGVIFVFDITKNWTFDYIKREVPCVPAHIPILILGNHRDMGHHRATAADSVHYFVEGLSRDDDSAEIRYAESSMRNGFGLKFIHKFFNLPFLQLQRETLLKQLETNREENNVTLKELDYYADSDESNYDLFIDGLTQKRRQAADALSVPAKMSLAEAQAIAQEKAMKEGNVAAAVAVASKPSIVDNSKQNVPSNPVGKTLQESASSLATTTTSASSLQTKPTLPKQASKSPVSTGNTKNQQNILVNNSNNSKPTNKSSPKKQSPGEPGSPDVDDFVPEGPNGIDKSFFDDGSSRNSQNRNNFRPEFETTDEDEEASHESSQNPLVAAYEEDVVPEAYSNPPTTNGASSEIKVDEEVKAAAVESPSKKFCILSSSDEEEERSRAEEQNQENSTHTVPLDLDLNFFFKDSTSQGFDNTFNATDALSEFSSSPVPSRNDSKSGDKKSKKSSKHKKSKHKKSSKKDKPQMDLEDFLNGPGTSVQSTGDVDLNAYEAL